MQLCALEVTFEKPVAEIQADNASYIQKPEPQLILNLPFVSLNILPNILVKKQPDSVSPHWPQSMTSLMKPSAVSSTGVALL